MKKYLVLLLGSILLLGCGIMIDDPYDNKPVENEQNNDQENKEENEIMYKNPIATIKFKDVGEMKFELKVMDAPQSVYNFTELANKGFYDGLLMHRIIRDFVAQGGDPLGTGTGGPGYSIKGEFTNNRVDNPTQHDKGAIAFARSMARDSAGSQFYIVTGNYDANNMARMNADYAAFGNLLEGEDVLDLINNEYASQDGNPAKVLIVESITVDTLGQDLPSPDKIN